MEEQVTIGIDIGTTSVKAVAASADGKVVSSTRIAHSCASPVPNRLEHDAATAWATNVRAAWNEVATGGQVAGGCVAAMVPSLAAVDSSGTPISPGLLYGDDRGLASGTEGSPAESGEFARFAAWAAAEFPDAAGLWPAQAVANNALCGRGAIDTTTAMTTLPLFDGMGWSAEECARAGIEPRQLPDLVPGTDPIGELGGAPLGGGTIDALAQQLVAGADHPGDVLVILGATLIVWFVASEWIEIDGYWTIPHSTPGLVLIGGPSNAGALFVDRIGAITGSGTTDVDPPDTDDVPIWLPYIRGERVPLHDPRLRASLHDVNRAHGPAAVLRAAHEASGFVVRRTIDAAAAAGAGNADRVVAAGGGTRSAPWVQGLADAAQLPVDVAAEPNGSALGAAFIARVSAGLDTDITDAARWARTRVRVDPEARRSEAMERRYQRFLELTERSGGPDA